MQFRLDQLEIIKVGDDLDDAYPLHHPRMMLLAIRSPDLYQIRVKKECEAMLMMGHPAEQPKAPISIKTEEDVERDILYAQMEELGMKVDRRVKAIPVLQQKINAFKEQAAA